MHWDRAARTLAKRSVEKKNPPKAAFCTCGTFGIAPQFSGLAEKPRPRALFAAHYSTIAQRLSELISLSALQCCFGRAAGFALLPGNGRPSLTRSPTFPIRSSSTLGHRRPRHPRSCGWGGGLLYLVPISGEWGGRDKNRYRVIWGRWFFKANRPEA